MNQQQVLEAFGPKHAANYDEQWRKLSPLRDSLHLLMAAAFADLRDNSRVLCVGAGTGSEILFLAQRFPMWHFTAVEPSESMLDVCRQRAEESGIAQRCDFHHGYLTSLPSTQPFDAATSLLVSQFISNREERVSFFAEIARRLRANGRLVSSDLSSDRSSGDYRELLEVWMRMMGAAGIPPEGQERMRAAYQNDVAILPQSEVGAIIEDGGFDRPILLSQCGLIHGWFARRRDKTL